MTELLERAISQLSQLPDAQQDAIATKLLEELDAILWQAKLDQTTDDQWEKLAAMVEQEMATDELLPLEAILEDAD